MEVGNPYGKDEEPHAYRIVEKGDSPRGMARTARREDDDATAWLR